MGACATNIPHENREIKKHKPITPTDNSNYLISDSIDNTLGNQTAITDHTSRNHEIFTPVKPPPVPKQKVNHKNGIERLISLSSESQNKFLLKWYHIENAIKQ
eukprot:463024_1